MDRLISEQAVIDVINGCLINRQTVIDKIKAIPLAEPKWIPVSERLPKKSDRYLAYIVNEHDNKLQYIMTCDFSADGYWNWFPDDECASDNVIAWMPLPKPYDPQGRSE